MKAIVFRPSATINRYYLPTFKLSRQFDSKKTEAEIQASYEYFVV